MRRTREADQLAKVIRHDVLVLLRKWEFCGIRAQDRSDCIEPPHFPVVTFLVEMMLGVRRTPSVLATRRVD